MAEGVETEGRERVEMERGGKVEGREVAMEEAKGGRVVEETGPHC